MRTPNPTNNSQSLLDLQRSKARYSDVATQLSSGKRIVNVGDDPTGSALVMDFQSSINRNNQYMTQIDTATQMLQGTETALDTVNNSLSRLLELGQQGLTETGSARARAAISCEVRAIGTDLVSTANTQQQGKYIFAGTKTTTMPFSGVVAAAPPRGETVGYHGNGSDIDLNVSISAKVTTNLPGNTVFYGPGGPGSDSDVFAAVQAMYAGLKSNDTAQIRAAYDNLETISARINDTITSVGGRQAGMEGLKSGMAAFNASLSSIQGGVESVDYPSAITEMNHEEVAERANLSVMGKVNAKSLFDYLA